eukprot:TRINITY_DN6171_c0_g1_i1.p1 TRINITY_DN6171_c0_g1~~TRINITY_DN6171_c0_g1_i1.p1  ORF type:complete len:83 (+),score=6.86 TRINITY_DN6171_c0_g1_i1:13-261(+)
MCLTLSHVQLATSHGDKFNSVTPEQWEISFHWHFFAPWIHFKSTTPDSIHSMKNSGEASLDPKECLSVSIGEGSKQINLLQV